MLDGADVRTAHGGARDLALARRRLLHGRRQQRQSAEQLGGGGEHAVTLGVALDKSRGHGVTAHVRR